MIWQQPWAWAGVAAVLAPVIIHLLGFGRAPRHGFPTLRFVQSSRLLPTRRTRIHDPWLLLLRAAIVLAAVAALAQPLIHTTERRTTYAASLARVVILDTSASAQRSILSAGWSADSARVLSRAMADSANVSRLLETWDVATAMIGAASWLSTQAMRREVVVLSDFQGGALDSVAVSKLPAHVGLLPMRLGDFGGGALLAAAAPVGASALPLMFTSPESAVIASAALEAARRIDAGSYSANQTERLNRLQHVAVVWSDYPNRDSLLESSVPVQTAWMVRLLHEVRSHRLVANAAAWRAVQGERNGQPLLLLLVPAEATTATVLSVFAALYDVLPRVDEQGSLLTTYANLLELDTATLSDSVLRAWTRAPSPEPSSSDMLRSLQAENQSSGAPRGAMSSPSDARWLWSLALLLLGAEAVVRRRMSRTGNAEPEASAAAGTKAA